MDKKYCPYCMSPVKEGETCKNCGLTEGVYTPRDHHLPLGTVLNNRYLVGRVLGEGGFGITYIGCDLNLEMKVAIKEYFPIDRVYRFSKTSLLLSNYAHAAEKYQSGKVKFLREARTMARLDKQQNIVSVRDFFEENNTAYIVMEYVEGTTLKELVNQRGGRIPAGELLYMLEPLFSALTSVHEMGLIHRDISPDNLMLENGKIKLLDFGCARESASQSETMTIALKQGYAPIEQYQHKGQGPWTDVYALSATIYFCLTGKTPPSAVDRLSEDEVIFPRKLGVDLTANQETALLYGMNVKAKERFQSVEELYAALYTNAVFTPIETISAEPVMKQSALVEPVSDEQDSALYTNVNPKAALEEPIPSYYESTGQDGQKEIKTIPENSAEKSEAPEIGSHDEEKPAFKNKKTTLGILEQWRNKKVLMLLTGCAALLAVVIGVVWTVKHFRENRTVSGMGDTGGLVVSQDGSQPGGQTESGFGSSDGSVNEHEEMETLFANATVLGEASKKAFQELMEDDTVSAIRISDTNNQISIYGSIIITKPVLVEENVECGLFDMVKLEGENACLWIEGTVHGDFILQTADGGKVIAANSGCFGPTLLWLEKEEDVRVLNGEEPGYGDMIIGGRNTLFKNAVSVRDDAALRQAMDENQAAIICEDITIKTLQLLRTPVLIEEGVTVTTQDDGRLVICDDDFVLWNEGKIQGELQIDSGRVIANYGEINSDLLNVNGILINLGDLETTLVLAEDVQGSIYQGSIYNVGTLRFPDGGYCGYNANLTNYGSVASSAQGASFSCRNGINNYGEFRIEEGYIILQSYLLNMSNGRILICDNARLENRGVIEVYSGELLLESEGILENEEGAIYYPFFDANYRPESGWFHFSYSNQKASPDHVREVTNTDELIDALQSPEVEKIYLTGSIRWDTAETVILTKEVEIASDAALKMGKGSELILDGCFLLNYGDLQADDLTLTHGGSLKNHGTLRFLNPDSIIKLGNVLGERDYNRTDCLMNAEYGAILECEIELYDNAMMLQKGYMECTAFHVQDNSYFANIGEIQWAAGVSIEVLDGGRFHNIARQVWSQNLTMRIGKDSAFRNYGGLIIESGDIHVTLNGLLESSLGRVTFGKNLSVWNDGMLLFCSGGDSTLLQGYLENHGTLKVYGPSGFVIDAPLGAENPARLNNQGEVRISAGENAYIRCDNGEFIGNEAIYE